MLETKIRVDRTKIKDIGGPLENVKTWTGLELGMASVRNTVEQWELDRVDGR